MHSKCLFLFATCLVFAEPAWGAHTLKPEEQRVLQRWLVQHTEYRIAADADCQCPEDILEMRTQSDGVWKPIPDYHPYTVTGDFNGDGAEDFAIVLIDSRAKEDGYTLLVFNGPFKSEIAPPAFVQSLQLKYRGLFYGPPRPKPYRLLVGRFASDSGVILVPHRKGYRLMAASPEE